MGFLKHFALPVFTLVHAISVVMILVTNQKDALVVMSNLPDYDEVNGLTPIESHALGAYGAASLALMFGCIMGIINEDSHFRQMIVIMELLFYGGDLYDSIRIGFPIGGLIGFCTLAIVSLIIHSKEPGLFTVDKNKKKDK